MPAPSVSSENANEHRSEAAANDDEVNPSTFACAICAYHIAGAMIPFLRAFNTSFFVGFCDNLNKAQ